MANGIVEHYEILQQLQKTGKIKVWSLLVSVFGDLAAENGQTLSGAFLTRLFNTIGIKPEAVRVALHRLRKDGWIEASKKGRNSIYRLSQSARSETKSASRRVYGPIGIRNKQVWQIAIARNRLPDIPEGWYEIADRTYLFDQSAANKYPDLFILAVNPEQIPDWIIDEITPVDSVEIASILVTFLKNYPVEAITESLEQLTARTLILHQWRRIALRDSTWTHMALRPNGLFAECHDLTHRALEKLPRSIIDDAIEVANA